MNNVLRDRINFVLTYVIYRYFDCESNMNVFLSSLVILLMLDKCSSQCRTANWWAALDHQGWAKCDDSTEYMTGMYRNVNEGNGDAVYLIEEASCCKATSPNQNQSSTCMNANWWGVLDRLET